MTNDSLPAGLPILSAGVHLAPEDGACLMEYVSLLAGEPFSDAPRCTDPLLAALARLVNDATSDSGRQRLGTLAPALAAAPRMDAVGQAALVVAVLSRVHDVVGRSRQLDRHLHRAGRRLHRSAAPQRAGPWSRALDLAYRRGPGPRHLIAAVDATSVLPEVPRDAVLRDLLTTALDREGAPVQRFAAQFTGTL